MTLSPQPSWCWLWWKFLFYFTSYTYPHVPFMIVVPGCPMYIYIYIIFVFIFIFTTVLHVEALQSKPWSLRYYAEYSPFHHFIIEAGARLSNSEYITCGIFLAKSLVEVIVFQTSLMEYLHSGLSLFLSLALYVCLSLSVSFCRAVLIDTCMFVSVCSSHWIIPFYALVTVIYVSAVKHIKSNKSNSVKTEIPC